MIYPLDFQLEQSVIINTEDILEDPSRGPSLPLKKGRRTLPIRSMMM